MLILYFFSLFLHFYFLFFLILLFYFIFYSFLVFFFLYSFFNSFCLVYTLVPTIGNSSLVVLSFPFLLWVFNCIDNRLLSKPLDEAGVFTDYCQFLV